MRKVFLNGLPAYQFHLLQKFSDQVKHAVFSREGGESAPPYDSLNVRFGAGDSYDHVKENRKIICKALDLDCGMLISANQAHGKKIKFIDDAFLKSHKAFEEIEGCDALVTTKTGAGLMMQVADCQAILMYDPEKRVIAAVHAGWKGLAIDISGEVIEYLKTNFNINPGSLLIAIAPSLGPCCAFFSDPEKELPASFHNFIDKKKRVDLWSLSIEQLQKHGIKKNNIELARVCTQCGNGPVKHGPHKFFSFRGEHGITGRFGVVIALF